MQLAYDYALRSIDDKRAILSHQGNFTEINFLLFDIPDALMTGLRVSILLVERQANGHFKRGGERHAALLALSHVVLQLQRNRVAAFVAEVGCVRVVGSAPSAQNFARMEGIGNDCGSAIAASSA